MELAMVLSLDQQCCECCEKYVVSRLKRGSEYWGAVEGEGEVRVRGDPVTSLHSPPVIQTSCYWPAPSVCPLVWKLLRLKLLWKVIFLASPRKHFCFQCRVTEIAQPKTVHRSHKGLNETHHVTRRCSN